MAIEAFAVGGFGAGIKKVEMNTADCPIDKIMQDLILARNYTKIVDFDDHFNDISLDWGNQEFAV